MKSLWLGLTITALAVGCSEANDSLDGSLTPETDAGHETGTTGHDATTGTSSGSGSGSSAPTGDTGTTTHGDATSSGQGGDAGASGLVINEISGKGTDYVELLNTGSAAFDLSGWGVTEAKHDDAGVPGTPKTAAVFPSGTMLATGAYALALGAPKDGGMQLSPCPASVCVQATWNVSNGSGATIYLLNPAAATVTEEAFPANTTGDGQSWGRIPNGTGSFVLNNQTPGTANETP